MRRSLKLRTALAPFFKRYFENILRSHKHTLNKLDSRVESHQRLYLRGSCTYLAQIRPPGDAIMMENFLRELQQSGVDGGEWDSLLTVVAESYRAPSGTMKKRIIEFARQRSEGNFSLVGGHLYGALDACKWRSPSNYSMDGMSMLLLLTDLNHASELPFRVTDTSLLDYHPGILDSIMKNNISDILLMPQGGQSSFNWQEFETYFFRSYYSSRNKDETKCSVNKLWQRIGSPRNGSSMCGDSEYYGKECCQLERRMTESYQHVLKRMKYLLQPTAATVRERSDREDVRWAMDALVIPSGFKPKRRVAGKPLLHSNPAIIACKFGRRSEEIALDCPLFERSFTTEGIGHTFNANPFWKMYRKKTWLETFYNEMTAPAEVRENDEVPRFPDFNGPGFSLEFLLDVSASDRRSDTTNVRSVAIHSPNDIPDLSGEVLEVVAGMHYSILVSPTLVRTDDGLELAQASTGTCFLDQEAHNLTVFASYMHGNCLFECQLINSLRKCGCIPWDFPRTNETVPICTAKGSDCFRNALALDRDPTLCPHCIANCNLHAYSYTVLTKPLSPKKLCSSGQVSVIQQHMCSTKYVVGT